MRKICLTLVVLAGISSNTLAAPPVENQQTDAAVSYQGFVLLTEEVQKHRQDRLISKQDFLAMTNEPDTVILDTRSKEAYDEGHIKGAIHLNFSDFTEEKLAKTIGDKDKRILIYCNNNFTDNVRPFVKKSVELALNVPTYINLYGYGYKNVYELKNAVSMHDPQMQIVATIP